MKLLGVLVSAGLFAASAVQAASVTIDFEDLSFDTVVTDQYQSLGVVFSSPPDLDGEATTPKIGNASGVSTTGQVLQDYSRVPTSVGKPFHIIAEFAAGTSFIGFTGYSSEGYSLTMSAYDADDNFLGSVTTAEAPYFGYNSTVSLSDVGLISKAVWETSSPFVASAIIDNLTFDSEVPVPAAAWLFGSAVLGLTAVKRRK